MTTTGVRPSPDWWPYARSRLRPNALLGCCSGLLFDVVIPSDGSPALWPLAAIMLLLCRLPDVTGPSTAERLP